MYGSSDDRMTHTMNPAIRSAVCKGSWKRLLISISSPPPGVVEPCLRRGDAETSSCVTVTLSRIDRAGVNSYRLQGFYL